MPPPGALVWPSSDEPTPKAITGTRCVSAGAHDLLHLSRRFGEGDAVRRLRRDVGRGMRMLAANRLPGLEALAELLLENAEHGSDAFLVAFDRVEVAQSHAFLREWTSAHACYAIMDA